MFVGILLRTVTLTLLFAYAPVWAKNPTIMLDPAGSADQTGRMLHANFERGITLQCAQRIQELLYSGSKPVLILLYQLQRLNPCHH